MFISNLIADASDQLTPTERRIASAVLEEPTLLAFGTVSALAERVGTSRPSIVRFANKLGFEGYTQLQEEVRAGVSQQLSRPDQRIRNPSKSFEPVRASLEGALGKVFENLAPERLTRLARPIARAQHVWVLSGETSRAGAHAFHSKLGIVRPNVHFVEEHTTARDLSGATPKDTAVVFDFARYRRHAIHAAQSLAERGVKIVAITDGPLSPLAALTDTWCELSVPAVGPFDSSMPAVVMAELLVAQIARLLQSQARERIDEIEALWKENETFLP